MAEKTAISFEFENITSPKIKVVGIGGGGCNSVDMLKEESIEGVELIAVNTDKYSLERSLADIKIQIGETVTRGMGTGGDPDKGRESAQKDSDKVMKVIEDTDILFIASAFGGGTGTGATPVIAELAKKSGILTIAFIMMPFEYEGPFVVKTAEEGLIDLREHVDSLLVVHNSNALNLELTKSPIEIFRDINRILLNAVVGIRDIIFNPAYMKLDLSDVKNYLYSKGKTLIGVGEAEGENKGEEAIQKAIHSPLLELDSIAGAQSILLHVTHGSDTTMKEIIKIMEVVREEAKGNSDIDVNLKLGFSLNDNFAGKIRTTVIATDFLDEELGETVQETLEPVEEEIGEVKENTPETGLLADPMKLNSSSTPTRIPEVKAREDFEESIPRRRATRKPPFLERMENEKGEDKTSRSRGTLPSVFEKFLAEED